MHEYCVRDHWRRCEPVVPLNYGCDFIGSENFQCGALRRSGQRVRVLAHIERTRRSLGFPVIANRLRDRKDMGFGKRAIQR